MSKILVTHPLPFPALEHLQRAHHVVVLDSDAQRQPAQLQSAIGDVEGLLSMLTVAVDAALLDAAPKLRVVANCAVGYDNVDVDAATARGIQVCNTPNVLTEATADLTWALLLALGRRIVEADRLVRDGRFQGFRMDLLLGRPIYGQTLGIIGLGRIGRAVARRARGFAMPVLYSQRRRADPKLEAELNATYVTLDDLLAQADIVTLHAPLTDATHHLLSAEKLALLKPEALLVNTSRGALIDEPALVAALQAGRLGGAALDVFEDEPSLSPGLTELATVVLTPHIGSATRATRARMVEAVCADLDRVLQGKAPEHGVNQVAGERKG